MTEAHLQTIERELGVRLPESYRELSLAFPFEPVGNDWIYWFYDAPERVIYATRYPHEDGHYDGSNWKSTYLVIGQSAAGDLYFLDIAREDSPVYCLSHEDYSITEDWPDFSSFVLDWLNEVQRLNQKPAPDLEAQRRGKNRRIFLFALFAMIFLFPVFVLPLLVVKPSGMALIVACVSVMAIFVALGLLMKRAIQGGIYY